VTITAPVSITISPTFATVNTGGTQQFTAMLRSTSNTAVTWQVNGVTGGNTTTGTISSSGQYTAPGTVPNPAVVMVTAVSQADTTQSASATVTVTTPASGRSTILLGDQNVESQPDSMSSGQAQAFQSMANVSGNVQSLVIYVDSNSTASQVMAGLYTDAGGHPGTLLSQGSSVQLRPGSWNPILLPATSVTEGTPYWIAILGAGSGALVLRSASSGCLGQSSSETSLPALPASWSGATTSTCPLSVFADSGKVVFYDGFDETALDSAWTVISRHGEYSQNETECNIPGAVSLLSGNLVITTSAQPYSCGDFNVDSSVRTPPAVWPYTTGDVQWDSLNFTYGTLEFRTTYPAANTNLWPAHWLLGINCQTSNKFTGDTITAGSTCPNWGTTGYDEIDVRECWAGDCMANLYHNTSQQYCNYPNWDTNPHTVTMTWTPSAITVAQDGVQFCNWTTNIPSQPMFLIMQTQTGGVAGPPNNSLLPATLTTDYVKLTQP
jgi:hypothetical protein